MSTMADLGSSNVVASTVVNDSDRGAILTVVAALAICCVGEFLSVRLVIRRPLRELFGRDDLLVVLATVGLPRPTMLSSPS